VVLICWLGSKVLFRLTCSDPAAVTMGFSMQSRHVIRTIRERGSCTRDELASLVRLPPATVVRLIRRLTADGLLRRAGYEESTGGRRRERIGINPDAGHAVGVHVATRGMRAAVVNLAGRSLAEKSTPDTTLGRVRDTIDLLCRTISALRDAHAPGACCGIGIGISGVIREGGRVSREFPQAERWEDVPLADEVKERCGIRPLLLNDVHAAALGESRFGGWRDAANIVFLHLGEGIAAGIVADGKLYQGATLNAGEIGHLVVADDGPVCYCGNRGCLETVAAPRAIVEACRDAAARGVRTLALDEAGSASRITFDHILAAADRGDRLATNLLTEAGRHIGRVAADLVNFFDPEVLILGGLLAGRHDALVESLVRTARSRALPMLRDATRIEPSHLKEKAAVLGASAFAFDRAFDDPDRFLIVSS